MSRITITIDTVENVDGGAPPPPAPFQKHCLVMTAKLHDLAARKVPGAMEVLQISANKIEPHCVLYWPEAKCFSIAAEEEDLP